MSKPTVKLMMNQGTHFMLMTFGVGAGAAWHFAEGRLFGALLCAFWAIVLIGIWRTR